MKTKSSNSMLKRASSVEMVQLREIKVDVQSGGTSHFSDSDCLSYGQTPEHKNYSGDWKHHNTRN